jgi:hypothetical protein
MYQQSKLNESYCPVLEGLRGDYMRSKRVLEGPEGSPRPGSWRVLEGPGMEGTRWTHKVPEGSRMSQEVLPGGPRRSQVVLSGPRRPQ